VCIASAVQRSSKWEKLWRATLTFYLVLQTLDLQIGIIYECIHLLVQVCVLLRQCLRKMLLIDDFLGRLVAVEGKTSTGTVHNDRGAQTTQYRSFVVFRGIEPGDYDIIWVDELGAARRTYSVRIRRSRKAGGIAALAAEDMTSGGIRWRKVRSSVNFDSPTGRHYGSIVKLSPAAEVVASEIELHTGVR
jgi:hypothetical protein